MKKLLLLAATASLGLSAAAQTSLSLADEMKLADMLAKGATTMQASQAPAVPTTGILFRVADDATIERLQAAGVDIRQVEGNIVIAQAPVSCVMDAIAVEGVEDAQLARKRRLLNNIALPATGVDKVHAGEDLPQPYDGTGVIAGILDCGLDPNHIAFLDENGKTRVKRFFHFTGSTDYCKTYSDEQVSTFSSDDRAECHGTHTMGIMAGAFHGLESGDDYSGIAVGSEIVAAGAQGYDANFTGALRQIADYAAEREQPCVINLSWGSNDDGPHDGSDAFTRALDNIAGEPGVHLFVASGNEGNEMIGVYKELSEDNTTMQTFMVPGDLNSLYLGNLSMAKGNVSVWCDTEKAVKAYLDIVDLENDSICYSLEIPENGRKYLVSGYNTPSGVLSSQMDRQEKEFTDRFRNSYMGGQMGVSNVNGCFRVQIAVDLTSATRTLFRTCAVALRIEGEPGQKVHAYSNIDSSYGGSFLYFGNKGRDNYDNSTGDGTLNSFATGKNAIIVGAYSTRQCEDKITGTYLNGEYIYDQEPELNNVVSFSSWGHMLDGTLRPDVLAPGYVIIAPLSTPFYTSNSAQIGTANAPYPIKDTYTDPATEKTYYWTIMAGTSMATPHMSGVAALWLQADPTLTTEEIREVIRETSTKPEDASEKWGPNGLVDAYGGIKYILNRSAVKDVMADESKIMVTSRGNGAYEVCSPGETGIAAVLTNLQGVKVASVASDTDTAVLDASSVTPGIYVLTAESARGNVSRKIAIK